MWDNSLGVVVMLNCKKSSLYAKIIIFNCNLCESKICSIYFLPLLAINIHMLVQMKGCQTCGECTPCVSLSSLVRYLTN